jgi:hypothetical protein
MRGPNRAAGLLGRQAAKLLQAKANLQSDLVIFDFTAFNFAPLVLDFDPREVAQCLRSPFNRSVDSVGMAYLRRASNLDDAVGVVGHGRLSFDLRAHNASAQRTSHSQTPLSHIAASSGKTRQALAVYPVTLDLHGGSRRSTHTQRCHTHRD